MTDLFSGELLQTWTEHGVVFLTLYENGITAAISEEDFPKVVREMVASATKLSEISKLEAA